MGNVGDCGIRWGGQVEPITRLIKGFSPTLREKLIVSGLSPQDATNIDTFVKQNFEVNLARPAMPIQDAIDLAEFLVDATKAFFRFKLGADTVGGDTEVAAVTRHEGFKWIKRKHHYPPHLNPLETDHVGHAKRQEAKQGAVRGAHEPSYAELRLSGDQLRKRKKQYYDKPKRRK